VRELCFGTLRFLPRLRHSLDRLLQRPLDPEETVLEALLLLGLYQLLESGMPPHAAIGETAEAARIHKKPWAVGLVNGVLRNADRRREELKTAAAADPVAASAHPAWLLEALRAAWPEECEAILAANNRPPPLTLRVNLGRTTRAEFLAGLATAGIGVRPIKGCPSAVALTEGRDPAGLPGYREGLFSVQDAGAQWAAALLAPQPGERCLDACAAPGGKAGHLLEYAPVTLTALDPDLDRLRRIEENLARLRLRATVVHGDATQSGDWWDGLPYQRILVDVPCSGTGVLRRHPDIKHLRRSEDIPALAARQLAILLSLWPLLAEGGRLLYVTCSLLPAENQDVVAGLLAQYPDAREVAITLPVGRRRALGWQILPGEGDMDGFYYACLEKSALAGPLPEAPGTEAPGAEARDPP
jgi:16S rRNA (cytosine967-C5)-methyltransferase